jgi:hypothetical protein
LNHADDDGSGYSLVPRGWELLDTHAWGPSRRREWVGSAVAHHTHARQRVQRLTRRALTLTTLLIIYSYRGPSVPACVVRVVVCVCDERAADPPPTTRTCHHQGPQQRAVARGVDGCVEAALIPSRPGFKSRE